MGQGPPGMHEGGQFPMSQPQHGQPQHGQPQHGHFPPQPGYAPDAGYQNLFGGSYPVQVSCWLFAARPAHWGVLQAMQTPCLLVAPGQGPEVSQIWSPLANRTGQVQVLTFKQP